MGVDRLRTNSEVDFGGCPLPVAESVAHGMLQIGAVVISVHDLFTWSSGWRSPIYCDARLVLGFPVLWDRILQGFAAVIEQLYPGVDVLAGTATAGIPHAAALASRLRLPMAYVRSSAKQHGLQKRVEGKLHEGAKTVVLEDTLSTGTSAYSAVDALRAAGVDVLAVLTIFSYDFPAARERMREAGVPAHRLVGYQTLVDTALSTGALRRQDADRLMTWREHPESFGQ